MVTIICALFAACLLVLLLLRLYCRMTVGRCYSQQDMTGKTVLITGASAGIGKATAFDLAQRNARVILACRNRPKAEAVKSEIMTVTGNKNIDIKLLDLESFESVRKCAEDVLENEERLDVLINNAGDLAMRQELTKDGCERCMQVNHFGHFLLTLLLLDLLQKSKPSRIINVSSIIFIVAFLNLDDLGGFRQNFLLSHLGNYYNRSKLANILFTTELARRLNGTGVTVNALHPGLVRSYLFDYYRHPGIWIMRLLNVIFGKSVEEGAQTSIYLAVHPKVEKTSGKFFYDCRERILLGQARDTEKAKKLFQMSEETVREQFPKNVLE